MDKFKTAIILQITRLTQFAFLREAYITLEKSALFSTKVLSIISVTLFLFYFFKPSRHLTIFCPFPNRHFNLNTGRAYRRFQLK